MDETEPTPPMRRRRRTLAVLAACALVVTSGIVVVDVARSRAAFSGSSPTVGNAFSTGSVTLSDDSSGSALFAGTDLVPGLPFTSCLTVTYDGTVAPAAVKLYAASVSGTLAEYVDLTVEEGTGGGYGSCTGFVAATTRYTGGLSAFGSAYPSAANALALAAAPTAGSSRVVRFTLAVQDVTAAQNASSAATLTFLASA
jgi:hypothetical protein